MGNLDRMLNERCRRCAATSWESLQLMTAIVMLVTLLLPELALAHVEAGAAGDGGFFSGLKHPVTGLDHLVAMVAVGLWGAILGSPAIWILPIAFPLIMTIGAVLGIIGVPLPAVDEGVAASAIVLGSMVAFNVRPPTLLAFLLIAVFAIFHGHPHGTALPDFGIPLLYAAGFVLSTGLLHVAGILLGLLFRWPMGRWLVRALGAGIALVGVYFFVGATGLIA